MKPAFALSLSQEGIVLLQRRLQGFVAVGQADPEDAALTDRLTALRTSADALSPGGFATKLILPESQILYTDVAAPGPDRAARRSQIAKALEGRTPYAVGDLVYDWSGTGRTVQVAVVARITLDEAEAFAEDHGFNPVCFVAVPPAGRFAGEPYFGMTARAGDHLPDGARLDRDQDPVRVVADDAVVAPDTDAPIAETPDTPTSADDTPFRIVVGDDPEVSGEVGVTAGLIPETGAPMPERLVVAVEAVAEDIAADVPETISDAPASGAQAAAPSYVPAAAVDDAVGDGMVLDAAGDEPVADPVPDTATAEPDASDGPDDDTLSGQIGTADDAAATVGDLPVAMSSPVIPDAGTDASPSPTAEFATRRARRDKRRDDRQAAEPADDATAADMPAPIPRPRLGPATDPLPVTSPGLSPAADTLAPVPAPRVERPVLKPASKPASPARRAGAPSLLSRILPRSQAPASSPQPPRLAARGARGGGLSRPAARGRPKYLGLALTGTLLVFMGVVGLASGWFGQDAVVATAPDTPAQDVAEGAGVASPDAVALPDPPDPGDTAEIVPPEADDPPPEAEDTAAAEPDPAGMVADPATEPAMEAAAEAAPDAPADALSVSSAGAPQPTTDALRDLALAAASVAAASPLSPEPDAAGAPAPGPVDPDPALGGEIALPGADALASDQGLPPQVLPVPYAEALRYDAAGLIEPTPEGVVTPDGFTLIAGRPARIPAARPEGLVPAIAVVDGVAIDPASATEPLPPNPLAGKRPLPRPAGLAPENDAALAPPADTPPADTPTAEPFADPALAGRLPLPRPAGLAVAAPAAEQTTTPATGLAAAPAPLPPPADPRHAALKPKARSTSASAAAEQRQATASAIEAAAAAALAAEAEAASAPGISGATRLAVASSRRPATRPSQFAASVNAALAAAASEPVAEAQPAAEVQTAAAEPAPEPEPAAEPEAIDEPEPESAAPDIPTRATVAKQATIRNALDLGEVSLIGVYGSSNNRRALVRMSTGRFVKVEVGDRLNGGKVAAIDATQLTYVKNGRSIVLKMIRDS